MEAIFQTTDVNQKQEDILCEEETGHEHDRITREEVIQNTDKLKLGRFSGRPT